MGSRSDVGLKARIQAKREELDAWVREVVAWHFDPATGTPFWLDFAKRAGWDPRKKVNGYADLGRFGNFRDEWLRGGPVRKWVPLGYADRPVSIFETGGSTGVPKARISIDDFRIDYEQFSATLPDESFPKGADWLQRGPTGPRRLRLAVEHLCQFRGGICLRVGRGPRSAIKRVKAGGIVAYPTESCYGLGCDPRQHDAVRRLLHIKRRRWQHGLILISAKLPQLLRYIDCDAQQAERGKLPPSLQRSNK